MKVFAFTLLFAGASLASAQVAPGAQPGTPSQTQPSTDRSGPAGSPAQTQPNDPNAMPATPPGFAPSVASDDTAAPKPRVIRISGGVMTGNLISKVEPIYPDEARSAHVGGVVVLSARIGSDGRVKNLAVVSGPQMLQTAAVDAVRQWVYRPYILNGDPVDVNTVILVNFNLR